MARSSTKGKTKGRRKSSVINVDFEGVKSGGGGKPIPDGNHPFAFESWEKKESDNGEYIAVVWKCLKGKGKGGVAYDNLSLQPQALWRMKSMLEALGQEVPDGPMDIDFDELVGSETTLEITNEKYEGRDKPRVTAYLGDTSDDEEEEESDEEEEDEESGEDDGEDGDEDEEEEEEEEESDEDDDDEEEEEEESDEDDEEEEDEEDEDEEEEEEKPKRGKKPAGKKSSSKLRVGTKVKFKDDKGKAVTGTIMSIDGDEALIEDKKENEWQVDLSELEAA